MATITFKDVEKVYGKDTVGVENLTFDVEEGEFLVLVGPSGCGKTTTLELIAGLQQPTQGNISIDGVVVNDVKPQDRGIAMVFQDYALYPHKTVRGNLNFGLKYSTDLAKDDRNERIIEVAEMLGIEDQLDQKPKQLSGGQQQRVALGRAIVRDPSLFLLDEPLSNLDAKLRTQMRAELQELQNDLNVTTVYVTHDQTEAMTMGDRIAVMNDGELQQIGNPTDVYNEPANEFVATFIGSPSINLFSGNVENGVVRTDLFTIDLGAFSGDAYSEGELRVGIRPQDLRVPSESEQLRFEATVTVIERLGDENLLHLEAEGHELVAQVDEDIAPGVGETVQLTFDPQYLYLFDARDGSAIKARKRTELTVAQ